MLLKKIQLHNFRNIPSSVFAFSPHLTIVVGENAQGKTNILESLYFAITGTGFRESREEELMAMGQKQAQVDVLFDKAGTPKQFRILLAQDIRQVVTKSFFIEKVRKGHRAYTAEQTRAVLFSPEQLAIITGAPQLRRDYFNQCISQFDSAYGKHLVNYEQALRKRNKLLEHHTSPDALARELLFWDAYLEKEGAYITEARTAYMGFLAEHTEVDGKTFTVEYVKNIFSLDRLEEKKQLELKIRKTLIGPQKDDFIFYLAQGTKPHKNIQKYGSRSEQRMGILWLKLNEIYYLEHHLHIRPILLLDDVFSEFDTDNKARILKLIGTYQSVMTTTELELVQEIHKKNKTYTVIQLQKTGTVENTLDR